MNSTKSIKDKNIKIFTKYFYKNKNNTIIENFNPGDYVTIFYLREESIEKLRYTGLVLNKKRSDIIKLFINLITFIYKL